MDYVTKLEEAIDALTTHRFDDGFRCFCRGKVSRHMPEHEHEERCRKARQALHEAIDWEASAALQRMLDNPPPANEALRTLMRGKSVWNDF